MDQSKMTDTRAGAVALPPEFVGKTLHEAIAEYGYMGEEDIPMVVVSPFEALYVSEDKHHVVWEKDFSYSGEKHIARDVFVEYLAYLMPELYNVSYCLGTATLAWATPDVETLTLGEGVARVSAETLRLLSGETTIDHHWDMFFTEENENKIDAMVRGARLEADDIVRAIMDNHSVSLSRGEL